MSAHPYRGLPAHQFWREGATPASDRDGSGSA